MAILMFSWITSWETLPPSRVGWYWQVPALYLEIWGPQLWPMGLNHAAPQDDCNNSVGSVWALTHTRWAGAGLWLPRLKLPSPCRDSAPELCQSLKLTASGKQPGGSGTSDCWGNEMQTDLSALALWASCTSSAPCPPHCRACAPQCSPPPGGCPKASHLGTAAYLPVFWPVLPVWNTDA